MRVLLLGALPHAADCFSTQVNYTSRFPFRQTSPEAPRPPFCCSLPTAGFDFSWDHRPLSSPPPHQGGSDGVFPRPRSPFQLGRTRSPAGSTPEGSIWTVRHRHSPGRNAHGVAARRAGGATSDATRTGPSATPAAGLAWVVMALQLMCDGQPRRARQRLAPRATLDLLHQAPLSGRDGTSTRVMLLPVHVFSPSQAPIRRCSPADQPFRN